MNQYISSLDFLLFLLYGIVIFIFAYLKKKAHVENEKYYKYYLSGLLLKVAGALGLCFIYVFYYKGGDTLEYYDSCISVLNFLVKNPMEFINILFKGDNSAEELSLFDASTGWPAYWYDHNSFFLVRLTCLLVGLSFRSYLVTSLLLAWISYAGIWRLFVLFCKEFPFITKELAIALLFIPSVAFWGSGLLKDTVTYTSCCWFTVGFYHGVIKRKSFFSNAIIIIISGYLILSIKPYILYCLIPGSAIWMVSALTNEIKSKFFKVLIFPLVLIIGCGGIFFTFKTIGNNLGKWSVNEVLERAVITQNDLVKDYYGGNTFDIGTFDASISSMLTKSPQALVAGLFRPFIFEARNPVMILSAIENTYFLYLTIYFLVKFKVFNVFLLIRKNNLIVYSIIFSLFFSFMVGLTTPNFGSLVRYRIPAIPFFLASLFVLRFYYNEQRTKVEPDEKC
jgi:hypothetical protein